MQQDQDLAVAAAYAFGKPHTQQRPGQFAQKPQAQHQGNEWFAGLPLPGICHGNPKSSKRAASAPTRTCESGCEGAGSRTSICVCSAGSVSCCTVPCTAGYPAYEAEAYDGGFGDLPSVDDLEVAAAAAAAAMEAVDMVSSPSESDEEVIISSIMLLSLSCCKA